MTKAVKIMFTEFGLPKNIVSDAGINFISDKFRQFCRQLKIEHAITSSHHKSNGQVEACVKLMKYTIKMYFDNNDDVNLALLQMRSTPIAAGLPSPATLLFNRPIRALLPK